MSGSTEVVASDEQGNAGIPMLTHDEVKSLAKTYFGIDVVKVSDLGSCQDANFKVTSADCKPYVMKFANISCTRQEIVLQNRIILFLSTHKECSEWMFPLPQLKLKESSASASSSAIAGDDNDYIADISIKGDTYLTRLLVFVPGIELNKFRYFSNEVLSSFGVFVATITKSLSSFPAEGADRPGLQWDLRQASEVIDRLIGDVADEDKRAELRSVSSQCAQIIAQHRHNFRSQVVHCDLAHYNVIAKTEPNGRPRVSGVIDFGDACLSWLVGDLAVAILSGFACDEVELKNEEDVNYSALLDACNVVRGYHSITALNESELTALWPLIAIRSIVNIVSTESELRKDPTNEYNIRGLAVEYRILNRIKRVPIIVAQEALRACAGVRALSSHKKALMPLCVLSSMLTGAEIDSSMDPPRPLLRINNILDLSATSQIFKYGNWKSALDARKAIESDIRREINALTYVDNLTNPSPSNGVNMIRYIAPYGVPRFYRSKACSLSEPTTISLAVDVVQEVGSLLKSPFDCEVFTGYRNGALIYTLLRHREMDVIVRGIKVRFDFKPKSEFVSKNCKLGTDSLLFVGNVVRGEVIGDVIDINNEEDFSLMGDEDDYANDLDRFLPPHVSLQVCFSRDVTPRRYTDSSMISAWKRVSPNPIILIDMEAAMEEEDEEDNNIHSLVASRDQALASRRTFVAAVQEHYFKVPPQIERGYQQYLYDVSGRCYVDMVNNVAVIGHSHFNLFQATTIQMNLLNTNSRFIYNKLGLFAEKIISKIPAHARDKLNVVMFVNSGSEATDLAMRVARTVVTERRRKQQQQQQQQQQQSGESNDDFNHQVRRDTICLEGAYHGITTASDEISTTLNDNPRSRESRPPWIHLVPMPNAFLFENEVKPRLLEKEEEKKEGGEEKEKEKGALCSKDIVDYYGSFVTQKIADLSSRGIKPSCFIAEPLSGNAGGVELPPGYLKRVYEEVRQAGGLCIADEVQVGYGRLGTHFWGFEEHGVVPDLLTMAKAAGNGQPLGYVVTSREIADEFGADGSLFSSAGGGPVSCAIGSAVLDTIEQEGLQRNAHEVGNYLHEKLLTLKEKYPHIIGCIHGHGLYQGIELTRKVPNNNNNNNSSSRSRSANSSFDFVPATREAYAICERLLELGIICHNTGDYSNVLKVKPPLCISIADADFIFKAFDICLKGW